MVYLLVSNNFDTLETIHNYFPNYYTEDGYFKVYDYENEKFYVPQIPKNEIEKYNFFSNIQNLKNILFSKIIFLVNSIETYDLKIYLNNLSRKLVKNQNDVQVFILPNFISKQNNLIYKMFCCSAYWNYKNSDVTYIVDYEINNDVTIFEPFYFIYYIENFKLKKILKNINTNNRYTMSKSLTNINEQKLSIKDKQNDNLVIEKIYEKTNEKTNEKIIEKKFEENDLVTVDLDDNKL